MIAQLYDEARAAMLQKRWSEAVNKLDRVMDLSPDFPGAPEHHREAYYWHCIETLYEMGRAHMRANLWSNALKAFKEAQSLEPDYRDLPILIGMCERQLGYVTTSYPSQNRTGLMGATALVAVALTAVIGYFFVPYLIGNNGVVAIAPPFITTPAGTLASVSTPATLTAQLLATQTAAAPAGPQPNNPINNSTVAPVQPPNVATPAPPRPTAIATRPTIAVATSTRTPTARPAGPGNPAPTVNVQPTTNAPEISPTPTNPSPVAISPSPVPSVVTPSDVTNTSKDPSATATSTPVATSTATTAPVLTNTPTARPTNTLLPSPTPTPTPRTVQVTATSYRFEPASLTFNVGERIHLFLNNNASEQHSWALFRGATQINSITANANSSNNFFFTAPAAGAYTMVCILPGHRDRGMSAPVTIR